MSLSARRAWIEIASSLPSKSGLQSLSARRAWIEIAYGALEGTSEIVALRKESVDRNKVTEAKFFCIGVALRKESVDRNCHFCDDFADFCWSLSARRAWIEIERPTRGTPDQCRSLSARRAWIEIMEDLEPSTTRRVALRKESVDRNYWWVEGDSFFYCRSPQGERG